MNWNLKHRKKKSNILNYITLFYGVSNFNSFLFYIHVHDQYLIPVISIFVIIVHVDFFILKSGINKEANTIEIKAMECVYKSTNKNIFKIYANIYCVFEIGLIVKLTEKHTCNSLHLDVLEHIYTIWVCCIGPTMYMYLLVKKYKACHDV